LIEGLNKSISPSQFSGLCVGGRWGCSFLFWPDENKQGCTVDNTEQSEWWNFHPTCPLHSTRWLVFVRGIKEI